MERTGIYKYEKSSLELRELTVEEVPELRDGPFFDRDAAEQQGFMPETLCVGNSNCGFNFDLYIVSAMNNTKNKAEFMLEINFLDRVRTVYFDDLALVLSFLNENHGAFSLLLNSMVKTH